MTITTSRLLAFIAAICFILAAFGVATSIGLVPLGLFFLAASMVVP